MPWIYYYYYFLTSNQPSSGPHVSRAVRDGHLLHCSHQGRVPTPAPQDPLSQFPSLGNLEPLPSLLCEHYGQGRGQTERCRWGNKVLGGQREMGNPRPALRAAPAPLPPRSAPAEPAPLPPPTFSLCFPASPKVLGVSVPSSPPPPPRKFTSSPRRAKPQPRAAPAPLLSSPRVLLPLHRFPDAHSGIRPSAPGVGAAPGPRSEVGSYGDSGERG